MMRKLMVILALAMVLCGAALAQAATLQDWIDLGSTGVQIDDKLFYNFSFASSGLDAADVAVIPLNDPFNPGIQFTAAWTVADGDVLDSAIGYSVQVLPGGNAIIDVSAEIQGFGILGDGVVAVAETTSVGNLLLNVNGGTTAFAEITFPPTLGPIDVLKDISVNAPEQGDFATVSVVINRFSEVPVPPAVWLFGSGLLGLAGLRFRKNRA
jgi:hypothetical protein